MQLLALAVALLGCCSAAQAKDVYPQGIFADASMHGVYAGADAGGCCWLAPSASFSTVEPQGANAVLLLLAAPPYAATPSGYPVSVSIDGDSPVVVCCVRTGVQEIPVSLGRRAAVTKRVRISVQSTHSFVPARSGLGSDTRKLTFLLEKVTFADTVTGRRYVNGVDPGALPVHRWMLAIDWAVILGGALAAYGLVRRNASAACIALLVTAPFDFSVPVAGTTLTLAKSVLLASLLALLLHHRTHRWLRERGIWLVPAAFAVFILSMCVSGAHAAYAGAAFRETLKAVQYLLTVAVAYCAYRIDPQPQMLRSAAVCSVLLVSVMALAQEFIGAPEARMLLGHSLPRIGGPLEGPNQLGAYLGVLLPVVLAFALPWRPRMWDILALAIGVLALALTFSRGGMLACALGLCMVATLRYMPARAKLVLWSAAVLWIALAAAVALSLFHGGGNAALSAADAFGNGLGTRSGLWHAALELWRTSPLTGIGPGNFEMRVGDFIPGVRTHPNNYFLQVLVEQGLTGLTAFLMLNVTIVLRSIPGIRSAAGAAAVAAVFAMGFHQLLDGLLIYPKVGIVFFTVAAIGLAAAALERETVSEGTLDARAALAL